MPPSLALGTNKLASSFGSFAIKFIRSGKVDLNIVLKLFPFVFIFAAGGASLATMLPAQILKAFNYHYIEPCTDIYNYEKDWGNVRTFSKLTIGKAVIFVSLMLIIGFYDGFLGGGTGSFMLFVLLMFDLIF